MNVAQTRTKIPAPRTAVAATFLISFRRDTQSIGIGTKIRYGSVSRFEMNVVTIVGLAIAGSHISEVWYTNC